MSHTKSKNLQYTSTEPAFLQRLRAQQFSGGADPDRHERQIARPRLAKRGKDDDDDDDDDAPTYVLDESGDAVSKEEWEAMVARQKGGEGKEDGEMHKATGDDVTGMSEKEKNKDGDKEEKEKGVEATRSKKQEVTEVGQAQKKRKVARVVGGDEEEDEKNKEDNTNDTATKPLAKKVKKKAKPVKLSFGD